MNRDSGTVARFLTLGWFCLPAMLPMLGCGRAEYEATVDQAIARLKIENEFRSLDQATTVLAAWKAENAPTGTKVTFRKPSVYSRPPLTDAPPDPNKPEAAPRPEILKPPFLQNFPGFRQSWFQPAISGRSDSVASLYVGALATEAGVADQVLQDVKTAYPEQADLTWTSIDVLSPDGKRVPWRMLSFTQAQTFFVPSSPDPNVWPATFLMLLREEQGRQILIAARWTATAGDQTVRRKEIIAAAGTLAVAVNAKID